MANDYSRDMTRISVAKILQTIGWHTVNTSPLEILTDITAQYIKQLAKMTNDYANLFNCTDANLDHLGLAFREFHVSLPELEEYISNVDMGPPPVPCPMFPVSKDNHLNFLKPGSKECVTRPVHIHEHLPPMFNVQDSNDNTVEVIPKLEELEDIKQENSNPVFKRPLEISPSDNFKRPRLLLEEEGRPTREISSVMMTTSGFISPAREGKLPESRTPLATLEAPPPPNPTIPPPAPPNPAPPKAKPVKHVEKKKQKPVKELFKSQDEKVKKNLNMKEAKFKPNLDKPTDNKTSKPQSSNKTIKTLAAARMKAEKCNTTITPIPPKPIPILSHETVKLSIEPDRKKANIFRKITNAKEKSENKQRKEEVKQESRENSPVLVIDEPNENPHGKFNISSDVTIELVDPKPQKNPEKVEKPNYFSDDSPPGTPLTPKTPEMIPPSPPVTKEKRKRKEKPVKAKKPQKPTANGNDIGAAVMSPRPKTPDAHIEKHDIFPPLPFPQFPTFTPQLAPGLIPPNNFFGAMPPLPLLALPPRFPPLLHPLHHLPGKDDFFTKPPLKKQQHPPARSPASPIVIDDDEDDDDEAPKQEKKPKEHKKEKKDKVKKKNKKDKVKDKAEKKKLKEEKKEKIKKEKKEKKKDKETRDTDVLVPKLTLKLGSPTPAVSNDQDRKLNIKPIVKREDDDKGHENNRDVSPEASLAKISALVTGQPKPKSAIQNDQYPSSADTYHSQLKKTMFKPVPKKEVVQEQPIITAPTNPPPSSYIDAEGNQVWICPTCGKQDDGSPMIGCDDCDAWYHWVCVGIQVPPDDNENWYCRHCLAKKQEVLQTDKKKKRKKREKKEH